VTRQVIKLGSSSIASRDGLALDVIAGLVSQIAGAQRSGHQIILVTSGAARLGRRLLAFEGPTAGAAPALRALIGSVRSALDQPGHVDALAATLRDIDRPAEAGLALEPALPAAVGQPALMALYRQLAAAVGVEVCQILVSRSDLSSARAMGDLGRLLREAGARGLLPIVNGNDATDPLSALDNDQVAVAVAVAAEASRLLFLTDVRAAYRDADLRDRIVRLTPAQARAVRAGPSGSGRGGMGSKLQAAARAACCGVECVVGSAREPDVVSRSLNPRARIGTVVRAAGPPLESSRRWIGGIAYSAGSVYVNRDAEVSLRTGSTLFLSGVKRVDGEFAAGDVVELLDVRHPERLLGRGSVALPASILKLLRALSPQQVACVVSILLRLRYGGPASDAVTSLVDPALFQDGKELSASESRAGQEAFAQLSALSADRAVELADSLMLAQPALCAAFLMHGGFRHGQVPADAQARRALRGIHAVHRESLVVFPAGEARPGRRVT
jgi:glutamate 5-kinase